jgi:hypothetical protein
MASFGDAILYGKFWGRYIVWRDVTMLNVPFRVIGSQPMSVTLAEMLADRSCGRRLE